MLSRETFRIFTLIEAFSFAAFIGWYIWRLQFTHPNSWVVFLVWLVASFVLHRDTPKTLGWRADNLGPAARQAAVVFGICIAALGAAGLYLGAIHRLPAHFLNSHRFFGYFAFCLLQQIALNSYLMDRLLYARERNILPLVLGQAVLGGMVWWVFPIAWHHSMRVGPGYYAFGNHLW